MPHFSTFVEANAVLARYVPNAKLRGSYSLERIHKLMALLGDPQNTLKVIHVAGTSGKTSTSYYASALLKAAGYKVGLTVSPHVMEVNERVQVDGEPLHEKTFCRELSEFLSLAGRSHLNPTYFEMLVAFAYWEFAKQQVDYAVVEVGLGGLLDGTNVVGRQDKVCVITDIGMDHMNVLGNTLAEIAAQKAGIIQTGNVVFCHHQAPEILNVFKRCAAEQHADLHILGAQSIRTSPDFLPLFQRRNFSLAKAAVAFVMERDGHPALAEAELTDAAHVTIPARMETFKRGNKTIILDGAHNAQKLHALAESIRAQYPNQRVASMVSFVDGKSFRLESSLRELAALTDVLIITTFAHGQDMPHGAVGPTELAAIAARLGFATIGIVTEAKQALTKLLERPEPILLVTGSFFLMNEMRPLLGRL